MYETGPEDTFMSHIVGHNILILVHTSNLFVYTSIVNINSGDYIDWTVI